MLDGFFFLQISIKSKLIMNSLVNLSPFPRRRYELIQTLPNHQYCTVTKYKNKAQEIDYLVYTYTLPQMADRTKEKIIQEIEELSKLEECKISVANKAYIYVSEELTQISLRVTFRNIKTLQQVLKAKKYTTIRQPKINNMVKITEIMLKMHDTNHPHGNISISTIKFKKTSNQFILGTPVYLQIHRWKQQQTKIKIQSKELSKWRRPSLISDVFSLGLVLLQLWLNQQISEGIGVGQLRDHLQKIEHRGIQYILQQMLADADERWTLRQVYESLNQCQSIKIPQPWPLDQEHYSECRMSLSLFDLVEKYGVSAWDNDGIVIEAFKHCSTWFGVFTFAQGKVFLKIVLKSGHQFCVDLSEQLNAIKHRNNWNWLNTKTMKEMINHPNTTLSLTSEGGLNIKGYYRHTVQQKLEQMKEDEKVQHTQADNWQQSRKDTPANNFDNLCRIQGENVRMGLVISENVVLTSAYGLQENLKNQDKLSFQAKQFRGGKPHQFDVWIASQEAELQLPPNYDFSLVTFTKEITLVCFKHYMKLVKNYSQQVIEEKIKKQDRNVGLSYQLGGVQFSKGELIFDRERFLCIGQKQKWERFLAGEPLMLNLPVGSCVIIGIYDAEGRGIIFTDQFYWTLYSIIVRSHGEQHVMSQNLPFIFIECTYLEVMQGDLPNINKKWINYFLASQRLDLNMLAYQLQQLQKDQARNGREIILYHCILSGLIEGQVNNTNLEDMELAVFHRRAAMECSGSVYKGRDNFLSALIHYKFAGILQPISFDMQEIAFYMRIALNTFRDYGFNPFILLQILKTILSLPNNFQDNERGNNISESIALQKRLGMVDGLKNIFSNILRSGQAQNASYEQINNIKLQLQTFKDYSFFKRKHFNYQKAIKRTQKSIQNQDFKLITFRLDELLARNKRNQNEAREDKIKNLWKSAITTFMSHCGSLDDLKEFEQLTKRYYEQDGYLAVSETFRNKQKQLINRQQGQLFQA